MLQPAAGWLYGKLAVFRQSLCSAALSIQDEGREMGLSCSEGRPSRGCLAQLVRDLGMHKETVGRKPGRRDRDYKGVGRPQNVHFLPWN